MTDSASKDREHRSDSSSAAGDISAAVSALNASMATLRGSVALLVVVIACFHPWFRAGMERVVEVLPLLVLVIIFVYVSMPVVAAIRRMLARHSKAAVSDERALFMTFIIVLGIAAIGLSIVLPKLVLEVQALAENLPGYSQRVRDLFTMYRDRLDAVLPDALQAKISEALRDAGTYAGDLLKQGVAWVGLFSQTLIWVVSTAIVVPMLGYYFLKDGEGIVEFWLRLIRPSGRDRTRKILYGVHEAMQSYVRGQAVLCGAMGVVTTLAMLFVLPQFAIGLGLVAGITEAIPVVGPILGAVPAVIIALAGKGWGTALLVVFLYTCLQQLESIVLVPRVMGESLGLHPLSLLLGMMVFGSLLGFWGVLLASPLVAVVKVLVSEYIEHSGEDGPSHGAPDGPSEAPASAADGVRPAATRESDTYELDDDHEPALVRGAAHESARPTEKETR